MVSLRCKMLGESLFEELDIKYKKISLGYAEIDDEADLKKIEVLKVRLKSAGLDILDDKKAIIIENIKNVIIEMVHYADEFPRTTFSQYISEKLHYEYKYLSNLFTSVKGITINEFIIQHKIEKAKELILYDELNFTEIAYRLNYSSVAHFSNQFKKVTGLTPSCFKKLKNERNRNIEDI
ncbi:MAG: helix-turn-helix domain-containing protein [Chitinophagaceae bacterium]